MKSIIFLRVFSLFIGFVSSQFYDGYGDNGDYYDVAERYEYPEDNVDEEYFQDDSDQNYRYPIEYYSGGNDEYEEEEEGIGGNYQEYYYDEEDNSRGIDSPQQPRQSSRHKFEEENENKDDDVMKKLKEILAPQKQKQRDTKNSETSDEYFNIKDFMPYLNGRKIDVGKIASKFGKKGLTELLNMLQKQVKELP